MRKTRSISVLVLALLLFVLPLLLLAIQPSQASTEDGVVEFYAFNNSNCPTCQFLVADLLPQLKKQYGSKISYKLYDLYAGEASLRNYRFMVNLEDSYGRTEMDLPQVYIGDKALIGPSEIQTELPPLIKKYIDQGGLNLPVLKINGAVVEPPATTPVNPSQGQNPNTQPTGASEVNIAYFYKSGCRKCDAISVELGLMQDFGTGIHVRQYDLATRRGIEMNEAMAIAYNVPKNKRGIAPSMFVGQEYLYGKDLNRKNLTQAIEKARLLAPPEVPWEKAIATLETARQELRSRLSGFSVLTVMGAGLVDGLNPCAFTVMVFLIAYLAFIGKTGKETLYVGAAMAITAFITYFLLGFGLLSIFNAVARTGTAGTWITAIVALLTAAFGIVAISDYVRTKATGKDVSTLGISKSMTQRIHKTIREHTKTSYLIVGAVVLGILVTVFEFGCTGQIYLPVITFVARSGGDRLRAIFYLVLFCIMSTLPLVIVFLLAYFGTSSKKLTEFGRKHAATLTLLGGIVMLVLAVVLLVTL